ncbi:hypothetical protein AWM68_13505 [Fictibacillus phosphorivorans]|uniref:Uncharacterized protein n=1 Tax=Fictibacillus phosphorivorans TaxID=1221500 RepID=A0A165N083_9BACL|nr:hypothetical protein AWM68_13505 [Fictibacillus phosphorivorans]
MSGMKAATNAEAAGSGVRIRTLSGNTQKAGMGSCFGWDKWLGEGNFFKQVFKRCIKKAR